MKSVTAANCHRQTFKSSVVPTMNWQDRFLKLLPTIRANARYAFSWVGDGGIGGSEVISVENAFPSLVDQKTFDRVQQKLNQRAQPKERDRLNEYILSKLLVCGITGEKIWGRIAVTGQRYYSIRRSKSDGRATTASASVARSCRISSSARLSSCSASPKRRNGFAKQSSNG